MKLRMMIYTAVFAALTAVGAFLRLPMWPVAITLQFLFTAMAGVLLGPKYGALSQAVYVAVGLVGIPVFTMGGGVGYVFQPSFGFLLGLIPAAAVIGALSAKAKTAWRIGLACLAGLGVLYLVGLPYMALICNVYMSRGMSAWDIIYKGMLLFLPGDMLKIVVTAVLCPILRKRLLLAQ